MLEEPRRTSAQRNFPQARVLVLPARDVRAFTCPRQPNQLGEWSRLES